MAVMVIPWVTMTLIGACKLNLKVHGYYRRECSFLEFSCLHSRYYAHYPSPTKASALPDLVKLS